MKPVRIMVRQRRGSKKRGKAAIFANVSREPYYLLSFALDVSFVAFLAHPSSSNPFASKISRKNSSYIAELSGTGQKKNRNKTGYERTNVKSAGIQANFGLTHWAVSCYRVKLLSIPLQFQRITKDFKLLNLSP